MDRNPDRTAERRLTRRETLRLASTGIGALAIPAVARAAEQAGKPIRVGIVGLDNYQVVDFTQHFNDPKAEGDLAGLQVVAAYPGGSSDIKESVENLPKWIDQIQKFGVKIENTPEAVLKQVDAVMLMSLDGRAHMGLLKPVLKAKKPVFIGRPLAASLEGAVEIFRAAEERKVPIFSCSQHRFCNAFYDMRHHPDVGDVLGVDMYGGCPMDPTHPDLYWHGIHGVEALFTMMGTGCVSVTRVSTDVTEFVTGTWKDGRVGTYRGIHKGQIEYQALVFGTKGISPSGKYGHWPPMKGVFTEGEYTGYKPTAVQIARFFKTHQPPVSSDETLEIFSFMEAASESKRQNGASVTLASVLEKAKQARRA